MGTVEESAITGGNREFFFGLELVGFTSFTLYALSTLSLFSFDNTVITIVPEPAATVLAVLAMIGVAAGRRRC